MHLFRLAVDQTGYVLCIAVHTCRSSVCEGNACVRSCRCCCRSREKRRSSEAKEALLALRDCLRPALRYEAGRTAQETGGGSVHAPSSPVATKLPLKHRASSDGHFGGDDKLTLLLNKTVSILLCLPLHAAHHYKTLSAVCGFSSPIPPSSRPLESQ